jgi:NADH-quinone oxidoreductase subunit M
MMLSLIVFLPLAGALLVLLAGGRGDRHDREPLVRYLALGASLVTFAATLALWWRFDPASAEYQFVEQYAWIPAFGIQYYIGVDGISLFLLVLTGFLTPLALLSSWDSVHKNVKLFSAFLLMLEAAMLGVFVAIDLFLFYIFWDVVLIPMYFLIGIWGYERRIYAAVKFILYTMAASLLMLVAIIGLAWSHAAATGVPSFNLLDLYGLNLDPQLATWFFLAFTLAFVVKVPLFPFHTWLPDAHVEAPTAGSVILAGVMLKMGTYGLLRFAFPLFPEAALQFAPWLALLAVIGIVYGALVAMVQPDMKKLVAYSSVSHLGFVVLGLAAVNFQGVQGSIFQMLAHGVSTGGLFLIVGMLSDRRHTRLIAEYGGLKLVMPRLVAAFLIITLASIALPLTSGFVGEFLILDRRVQVGLALRRRRGDRRHPLGGLHALDVPARELRRDHQREEPRAAGPHAARVDHHGPDRRGRDPDGRLPRHLPPPDGAVGEQGDRPHRGRPAGAGAREDPSPNGRWQMANDRGHHEVPGVLRAAYTDAASQPDHLAFGIRHLPFAHPWLPDASDTDPASQPDYLAFGIGICH